MCRLGFSELQTYIRSANSRVAGLNFSLVWSRSYDRTPNSFRTAAVSEKLSIAVKSHDLKHNGRVENHVERNLSIPNRDSKPDLPVISNQVYCESDTLDHAAANAVVFLCEPLATFLAPVGPPTAVGQDMLGELRLLGEALATGIAHVGLHTAVDETMVDERRFLREAVLHSFKNLHRARKLIFKDDDFALQAARTKINEEYRQNKHVTELSSIEELVKFAESVEEELKSSVIQAREVKPGRYGETKFQVQTKTNVHKTKCPNLVPEDVYSVVTSPPPPQATLFWTPHPPPFSSSFCRLSGESLSTTLLLIMSVLWVGERPMKNIDGELLYRFESSIRLYLLFNYVPSDPKLLAASSSHSRAANLRSCTDIISRFRKYVLPLALQSSQTVVRNISKAGCQILDV
uniref:Uncharacterized protein n=1 Tax=Timema cristinae TaxID=61476 RepID=A0A7R9D903_TIMCR|nr:unnamed protein product [Timema cristinae]